MCHVRMDVVVPATCVVVPLELAMSSIFGLPFLGGPS